VVQKKHSFWGCNSPRKRLAFFWRVFVPEEAPAAKALFQLPGGLARHRPHLSAPYCCCQRSHLRNWRAHWIQQSCDWRLGRWIARNRCWSGAFRRLSDTSCKCRGSNWLSHDGRLAVFDDRSEQPHQCLNCIQSGCDIRRACLAGPGCFFT
jgi:hypothetical protein